MLCLTRMGSWFNIDSCLLYSVPQGWNGCAPSRQKTKKNIYILKGKLGNRENQTSCLVSARLWLYFGLSSVANCSAGVFKESEAEQFLC